MNVRSQSHARGAEQEPDKRSLDAKRLRRFRRALLRWGASNGRSFFWRSADATPFSILVAEILLAKTRSELVHEVAPKILERFPTPAALSTARPRVLERLLYPLGLQRKRARQLIACSRSLTERHGGQVPRSREILLTLPAVGRYAANAIACVAFDEPYAVIDANVSRVYQRLFVLAPPPPRLSAAHEMWHVAEKILPKRNARRFNWALLDLGGTVCRPKRPKCDVCPASSFCAAATRAKLLKTEAIR